MPTRDDLDAHLQAVLQQYPNVPLSVARSMLMTESGGNVNARSPKGAIGPMQLMPKTARDLGVDPYDWRQNIEGGVRYLSSNIDRFKSVPLGVAAYHAGPGAVERAGGIPATNDGIMTTSNYVRRIAGVGDAQTAPPAADDDEPRPLIRRSLDPLIRRSDYALYDSQPEPAAKAAPTIWSDTGNVLGLGLQGLGESFREGVRQILGDRVVQSVDQFGRTLGMADIDEEKAKNQAALSPEMAAGLAKDWISEDKNGNLAFGPAWTDWRSYYGGFLQSLPEQAATMLPAIRIAKAASGFAGAKAAQAALRAGATEAAATDVAKLAASKALERTGYLAGAALEGLDQAGHSAIEVRDQINKLPDSVLDKSEAFQALLQANGGDRAAARAQLANDRATTAYALAGIATGIFGGAGDTFLLRVMGGKGPKSLLGRIGGGMVAEGLLEEAPQSYLSQIAQNYAVQAADPSQRLTEGAANQAIGGAVIGALQGGGMAAIAPRGTPIEAVGQPGRRRLPPVDQTPVAGTPPPAPQNTGPTPPNTPATAVPPPVSTPPATPAEAGQPPAAPSSATPSAAPEASYIPPIGVDGAPLPTPAELAAQHRKAEQDFKEQKREARRLAQLPTVGEDALTAVHDIGNADIQALRDFRPDTEAEQRVADREEEANVQRKLAQAAAMQDGDVGRKKDGAPFASAQAAQLALDKGGKKDTHDVVQLGPDAFVLRPRPVDESANLQGSPVDKAPEMQGQPAVEPTTAPPAPVVPPASVEAPAVAAPTLKAPPATMKPWQSKYTVLKVDDGFRVAGASNLNPISEKFATEAEADKWAEDFYTKNLVKHGPPPTPSAPAEEVPPPKPAATKKGAEAMTRVAEADAAERAEDTPTAEPATAPKESQDVTKSLDDTRHAAIQKTADEWGKDHVETLIRRFSFSNEDAASARAEGTDWGGHQDFLETALENGEEIPQRVLDDYRSRGVEPDPKVWPLLSEKLAAEKSAQAVADDAKAPSPPAPEVIDKLGGVPETDLAAEPTPAPAAPAATPPAAPAAAPTPAFAFEKDEKGNRIWKVGERVVLGGQGDTAGRHGTIKEVSKTRWQLLGFGTGERGTGIDYHYTVTTDSGAESYASPSELTAEEGPAPAATPDIEYQGKMFPPPHFLRMIDGRRKSAEGARGRMARAKKPSIKADHQREAEKAQKEADAMQAVYDAWAKANGQASSAPAPAAPTETATMTLVDSKDKNGKAVHIVVLKERVSPEDFGTLRARATKLNGYWYGKSRTPGFNFRDRAQALEFMGAKPKPAAPAPAPAAGVDVARLRALLNLLPAEAAGKAQLGAAIQSFDGGDAALGWRYLGEASRVLMAQHPYHSDTLDRIHDEAGSPAGYDPTKSPTASIPSRQEVVDGILAKLHADEKVRAWISNAENRADDVAWSLKGPAVSALVDWGKATQFKHNALFNALSRDFERHDYLADMVRALRAMPAPAASESAVGTNAEGQTVRADANGVRSVVEDGVRVTEPVTIVPTRGGVKAVVDTSTRPDQFKTEEEKAADLFAKNTIFTADKVAAARARLKAKLGNVNAGLDPEMMLDGITIAGGYIEAGARAFADYAERMIADFGRGIIPYLRSFYEGARYYPGLDNAGMTPVKEVDAAVAKLAQNEGAEQSPAPTPEEDNGVHPEQAASGEDRPAGDAGPGADDAEGSAGGGKAGRGNRRPRGGVRGDGGGGQQQIGLALDAGEQPGGVRGTSTGDGNGHPASGGDRAGPSHRVPRKRRPDLPSGVADFHPAPGALSRSGSWRAQAATNLDIIELVKKLEAEQRWATPDEQALLAKWTGWGASEIANGIFRNGYRDGDGFVLNPDHWGVKEEWKPLIERAKALMTPQEVAAAARSTQYAHYTSETVIRGMWDALARFGFKGGKIMEPGMGTGLFPILAPKALMDHSVYTGIEFEPFTARIARLLLPEQNARQGDFIQEKMPPGFFDLAVGNPPFAKTKIEADPDYKRLRFSLHDYFFAKTIDSVRPGGIMAFVTSRYSMDKANDRARQYLAERADLIGAIRLPNTAFKQNAGTEVVTDVLFFQRREPGTPYAGKPFLALKNVDVGEGAKAQKVLVNEYFVDNPKMVLGAHSLSGSMYGADEYTVTPDKVESLDQQFANAVKRLPEGVYTERKAPEQAKRPTFERDMSPKAKKEGQLYVGDDGEIYRREYGQGRRVEELKRIGKDGKEWLKSYVSLRDALKQARYDQLTEGDWQKSLKALNKAYADFVAKHGPLQSYTERDKQEKTDEKDEFDRPVMRTVTYRVFKHESKFGLDADSPLVRALETINEAGKIEKGPFLRDRVLKKPDPPKIENAQDALMVSLSERGRLDLPHIAELANVTQDQAIEQLGDEIYYSPSGEWQLADQYLSGDVRRKLAEAKTAAETDPAYERNVQALLKVQPQPLGSKEITVGLGSPWIPLPYINQFAEEVVGIDKPAIEYQSTIGQYLGLEGSGRQAGRGSANEWATDKRSPNEILDAALNGRTIKITYTDEDKRTHVDEEGTAAANEMVRKLREAFQRWVWQDADRAGDLLQIYNEKFNNIAPRAFNGAHLQLPGLSLRYKLYPHQKRAIWRIIQTGDTYLAHAVGAGKTLEMIVSAMEQRRLGLIRTPMFVVPNHMLQQFSSEFLDAYPAADIMVADEENFHKDNRRRFVAQAAMNQPDAIIITHSAFMKIKAPQDATDKVLARLIADLENAMEDLDDDQAGKRMRKRIEQRIEQIEQRFGAQANQNRDDVVDIKEMGVDFLYIDEAHEFRKLDFVTNHSNVKGITPEGSAKALDLYIKVKALDALRPGRSHVFASGTPVTNTLGELYSVQRFMAEEALERDGLQSFDGWISQFAQVASYDERNAAGKYEVVERLGELVNVPELMSRVRMFMDVVTLPQLKELVKLPAINTGGPQIILAQKSPELTAYMRDELEARIAASRAWKPSHDEPNNPDPLINIITDARLAAIDMRFANPKLEDDPGSKLNVMLDKIIATYKATANQEFIDPTTGKPEPVRGATQIVFSAVGFGDEVAKNRGFDVRAWVAKRLKAGGVPLDQVAWMNDYKSHSKKHHLFRSMREGKIRVLFGSPKNMGTGVNVQKRLAAEHYLSPPWYPADEEQPRGRIVRQGNQNDAVDLFWYATKETYDSTQWQMIARKSRFIEKAMSGGQDVRKLEDVSEATQYEQASALASGDERVIRYTRLRRDVESLELLQRAHADEQYRMQRELRYAQNRQRQAIERLATLAKATAAGGGKYLTAFETRGSIAGTPYKGWKELGTAVVAELSKLEKTKRPVKDRPVTVVLGDLNGHPIEARLSLHSEITGYDSKDKPQFADAVFANLGVRFGDVLISSDLELGNIAKPREESALTAIGGKIAGASYAVEQETNMEERAKKDAEERIAGYQKKLGAPFDRLQELVEKIAEAARLRDELMATDVGVPPAEAEAMADALAAKQWEDEGGRVTLASGPGAEAVPDFADNPTPAGSPKGWVSVPTSVTGSGQERGAVRLTDATSQTDAETLRAAVEASIQRSDPAAWLPAGAFSVVRLRHDAAVQRIAGAFGKRVVAFESDPRLDLGWFAGAANIRPDVIYIRADVAKPHLAILGHELLHTLRRSNTALYEEFRKAIEPLLTKGYERFGRDARAWKNLTPDKMMEEFLGDLVGDGFMSRAFWTQLGERSPSLLQRIYNAVLVLIDRARVALGGYTPRTREFLRDYAEALKIAGDVMAKYADAQGTTTDGEVRFAPASEGEDFAFSALEPAKAGAFTDSLKLAVQDRINGLLNSTKTFNLWHRTVGTQFHKAQIDADFKPVFDATQRYINDVSQFAMDASQEAPKLLPRLEDVAAVVRDAAGRNAKAKDVAIVAQATFDATLANQKLTDDDLRGMKLTPEQIELFHESRSAIDRSLDDLAASVAAQLVRNEVKRGIIPAGIVTEAKYNPGRAAGIYDAAVQQLQDEADGALRDAKKQAKAAIDSFDKATKAATEKVKGITARTAIIHDRGTLRDALVAGWADAVKNLEDRKALTDSLARKVRGTFERASKLKAEGYAPLMRFGDVSLAGYDGDELVYFSLHENDADALKRERQLREDPEMQGVVFTKGRMSQSRNQLFAGITPETLSLFGDLVGVGDDAVFQDYLKAAVATRSALKRLIHRKGTAGYDTDLQRVLAQFITSNGRLASRNYHYGDMVDAAAAIPQSKGDVVDQAVKLIKYVQNPTEEASALRGFLFINYLGGSIASALVNMTQPITMTLPFLGQFDGNAKAAAALTKGMAIAARKAKPAGELGRALALAEREGITAPHELYQLQAEAIRGVFGRNIWMRRGIKVWGSLFSLAEQFNRVATFAAAYEIGQGMKREQLQARGTPTPYQFAVKAVQETQGIYNRGNRPNWARGPIGATVMTFKQFSISYLELLKRLPPKQQMLMMAILFVLSGLQGIPFAEDIEDVLDAIGQGLGYSTNTRKWLRKNAVAILGKSLGEMVTEGASTGTPFDVSRRIGLGNLIPGTAALKRSSPDSGREFAEVLGPAGGLAQSAVNAFKAAAGGDFAGAARQVYPVAVQNAFKAAEMWQTGEYRDTRQRKVVEATKLDALLKGVGVQPQSIAEAQRKAGDVQQDITLARVVESEIAQKMAEGRLDHDPAKVEAARKKLQEWNRKNPDQKIRIDDTQIQRRIKEMRLQRSERLIKSAPKELRPTVRAEIAA